MSLTAFQAELYVKELDVSIDFYRRVLGFSMGEQESNGYTPMHNGQVTLALSPLSRLPAGHLSRFDSGERPGLGVQFVFWAEDMSELYAQVQAQEWPIAEELMRRPWGMEDFCIQDPDGYFLRFNAPVPAQGKREEK